MVDQRVTRQRKPRADAVRNRERVLEAARLAFGDSTARRRTVDEDPQLQKALELLRRGTTQQDLFALVTAKRTYARMLRLVVGEYVPKDDVEEELARLKRILANGGRRLR